MKIVITGATGFLGLNLANRLYSKGHDITALGRNKTKGKKLEDLGIKFLRCSLSETEIYKTSIISTDVVIHCAALSSPWDKWENFVESNITGTEKLLELVKLNKKIRFIHISSPSIYFKFKDEFNITEDKDLSKPFASMYTESKFEAEKVVDKVCTEENLFYITLRPRGIFGPGDETLLPRLIRVASKKGLPQLGDGKNIIDLTYVDNVSQSIELCLTAPDHCRGKKYNITNGEPVELWPFLNTLFNRLNIPKSSKVLSFKKISFIASVMEFLYRYLPLPGEPPLTHYTVGLLSRSQTLSIKNAQEDLKYDPEIKMDQALDNVVKWWEETQHA